MTKREKMESLDNIGFFKKIIEIAKLPKIELINWENYFNTDESEPYPWVAEQEQSSTGHESVDDKNESSKTIVKEKQKPSTGSTKRKSTSKKTKEKRCRRFVPTQLEKCEKECGLIVRKKRNDLKIRMEDFADMVGISKSAIGNFETGKYNLSDENLEKMADILGIDADYFIALANEEHAKDKNEKSEESDETDLSAMIMEAMRFRNLTPENCCTKLRVSPETVKRWMKGETIPMLEQENDVVRVFGFDMHQYQRARRRAELGADFEKKEVVMNDSDFRERVKEERERKGWSRAVVDEKLRFAIDTTKFVETGEIAITPSLVNKYSDLFRIRVDRVKNTVC